MNAPLSWRTLVLPLTLTLLWCLLLLALFRWTIQREDEHTEGLARIQTETLFASMVDTRAWNARHGGVWVEESAACPANPWLPEQERTIRTEDGKQLVRVNPAYMTRQIAESTASSLASFRISSLTPIRPENRADKWETGALLSFLEGKNSAAFERIDSEKGPRYRYMSALRADTSCFKCHTTAKVGDVIGGISVSISADPLLEAAAERKRTIGLAFALIGIIGTIGIGGATLQINRKKELAETANRTKSAFLANMTHDMRTPLAGMLGMTELLERETLNPRHRYLLQNLRAAADSLLNVVDGIMRYALLEAEGKPMHVMPFSLEAELKACMDALRPACESRNIRLELVRGENLPNKLLGDGFRLRQALGNLLGNAVKFTEQGSVTLRVMIVGKKQTHAGLQYKIAFQVIDTGKGIPSEEQTRIFETFEQGTAARKNSTEQTGVGLGLAIARNIAQRFGGELTLSSTPGHGSVFTLTAVFEAAPDTLAQQHMTSETPPAQSPGAADTPAASNPAPERAQAPESTRPYTGKVLVVAEDTPVTAVFLHETLSIAGYSVHVANDGEDALHLIRTLHPDAVVLDMRLPDMTGLDIADLIRTGALPVPPETPILVLTATLTREDEEALLRLNIDRWAQKPVQTSRLLETVASLFPVPPQTLNPLQEITMPTLFDRAAALDDMDGNAALLDTLCAMFLNDEPRIRASFLLFAEQADMRHQRAADLRRQAHSLKNGAGTLHLERLRAVCSELEQAEGETLPILSRVIDELRSAADAVRQSRA